METEKPTHHAIRPARPRSWRLNLAFICCWLPRIVAPCSTIACCRVTTSPSITAPDRTVTTPLNATTSPWTVPDTSASPSKTTTLPVTVPAIVADPWKIRAVSTTSPFATSRWPENTI